MHRLPAGLAAIAAAMLFTACSDSTATSPTALRPLFSGGGGTLPAGSTSCNSTAASGRGFHATGGTLVVNSPSSCDVLATGVPVHVNFTYDFKMSANVSTTGQPLPDRHYIYLSKVYDDGHVEVTPLSSGYRDGFTDYTVDLDVTPAADVNRIVISVGHNEIGSVAAGGPGGEDREFVVDLWKPLPVPTVLSDTVPSAGASFGTVTFGPIVARTKGVLRETCDGGPSSDVLIQDYAAIPSAANRVVFRPSRYGCYYQGTIYSNVGSGNDAIGQNIEYRPLVAATTANVRHGTPPSTPFDSVTVDTLTIPGGGGGEDPPMCFDVYDQYGNLINHNCKPVNP